MQQQSDGTVILRIAYVGVPGAGKGTNLAVLHRSLVPNSAVLGVDLDAEEQGRLISIPSFETIGNHKLVLEAATLSGRSSHRNARQALVRGVDGIVLVIDCRREALDANIEQMNELDTILRLEGSSLQEIPLVIQYNKTDLPEAIKVDQLDPLFNHRAVPTISSVANRGVGVPETWAAIVKDAMIRAQEILQKDTSEVAEPNQASRSPEGVILFCAKCDSVLEVPSADPNDLFTCGSCGASLEVVDPERGITRLASAAAPKAAPEPRSTSSAERPRAVPSGNGPAQGPGSAPHVQPQQAGHRSQSLQLPDFTIMLPGFECRKFLDESILGTRFLARERDTSTLFRVLMPTEQILALPEFLDTIEASARTAQRAQHPNLLPLDRLHWHKTLPLFVSPDPQGYEPLSSLLARQRTLQPQQATSITLQTALALEEAARFGAVHGFLNPSNILIGPDDLILLDDLAIPKPHRYMVQNLHGQSPSTEYTIAPEHLLPDIPSDIRSDIFLLGALLYRMITGQGLITGYSAIEAVHQFSAKSQNDLHWNHLPKNLQFLLDRMIAVDRRDRFQTYGELMATLAPMGDPNSGTRPFSRPMSGSYTQKTAPASRPVERGTGPKTHHTSANRPTALTPTRRTAAKTKPVQKSSSIGWWILLVVVLAAGFGVGIYFLVRQGRNTDNDSIVGNPISAEAVKHLNAAIDSYQGAPANVDLYIKATEALSALPAGAPECVEPRSRLEAIRRKPLPPLIRIITPAEIAEIKAFIERKAFEDARKLLHELPVSPTRTQWSDDVEKAEDIAKRYTENEAAEAKSLRDLEVLLASKRQWKLRDQATFLSELETKHRARLSGVAAVISTTATTNVAGPTQTLVIFDYPLTPLGFPLAQLMADEAIDAALLQHDLPAALEQVRRLQESGQALLAVKPALWKDMSQIVTLATGDATIDMMIANPTKGGVKERIQRADSVNVIINGVTIPWTQIPARDLAGLFRGIAASGRMEKRNLAICTLVVMVAQGPSAANDLVATLKKQNADEATTMVKLQDLARDRQILGIRRQAIVALEAGRADELAIRLDELDPFTRTGSEQVRTWIEQLREGLRILRSGRQVQVEHQAPKRVETQVQVAAKRGVFAFESDADLSEAFALKTGNWYLENSWMQTGSDPARLERSDMETANRCSMKIRYRDMGGSVLVSWRDAVVRLDLDKSQILMSGPRGEQIAPRAISWIKNTPVVLDFTYQKAEQRILITINREPTPTEIGVVTPGNALVMTSTGKAGLGIDELAFTWEKAGAEDPLKGLAQAIGNIKVEKDNRLNLSADSGLAIPLGTREAGIIRLRCKGTGTLKIAFGDLQRNIRIEGCSIPMNQNEMSLEIRFTQKGYSARGFFGGTPEFNAANPTLFTGDRPPQFILTADKTLTLPDIPKISED